MVSASVMRYCNMVCRPRILSCSTPKIKSYSSLKVFLQGNSSECGDSIRLFKLGELKKLYLNR